MDWISDERIDALLIDVDGGAVADPTVCQDIRDLANRLTATEEERDELRIEVVRLRASVDRALVEAGR